MIGFSKVSSQEEREFERKNVERKREAYLESNPMDRFANDPTYREKVQNADRILGQLFGEGGDRTILDLGGNTGGEATVLTQMGYDVVLADINEAALEIAMLRAEKFALTVPKCVTADVHALPFVDQSFRAVMVVEALHHFENYHLALSEILRVLRPGGFLLSYEPIGWNPVRRLSELRDRFRGTIEKSFTKRQLIALLKAAGFERIDVRPVSSGRSSLQMDSVPRYRRFLARFHASLQQRFPRFFGNYEIVAYRPEGSVVSGEANLTWPHYLRSPVSHEQVVKVGDFWVSPSDCFPDVRGVPVLIKENRRAHES